MEAARGFGFVKPFMAIVEKPRAAIPVSSRRSFWLGAALVAAVALAYGNSLNAPFIFDDFQAVVNNPTIRDLHRPATVLSPPLDGAGVTGRPLVNLSFALNYALGGLDVRGYHLGSMLLHALGSLVLFGLLRRLCLLPALAPRWGPAATPRAWCIALLWAVHPLLTESVTCVVQRNEVLAGLCYLLTLYAFVRSVETGSPAGRWQAVSAGACLLGVAGKEIVATAPLLVLLLDRTFVAGTFAGAWRARSKYYGALAATWLLLAWLMTRNENRGGIVGFGLGMGSWEYLVTQCRALTLYLKLSLWPHPLVVDYGHEVFRLAAVWREAVLVTGLGLVVLWALVRRPRWGFAGACFFVILAPSSSFVPLTTQTIAEHRMYLPLVVIVAGVVFALEAAFPRRWVIAGLLLALAAGALTVRRNADYQDELSFWQATLAYQPKNARIYANIGDYHRRRHEWPAALSAFRRATELRENFAPAHTEVGNMLLELGRPDEALAEHRIALGMWPADAMIHYHYGAALLRAGQPAEAAVQWEEALRLRPGLALALKRLSELSLKNGDLPGALARFEAAADSDPLDAEALDGWGRTLTAAGKFPEAVAKLEAARTLRPDVPEIHYNLGNAWLQGDHAAEAVPAYREALRLKPDFPAARHNLAVALMTIPGHAAEAVTQLEEVVARQPEWIEARVTLALALESAGHASEALAQAREVVRRDPGSARAAALVRRLEATPPR